MRSTRHFFTSAGLAALLALSCSPPPPPAAMKPSCESADLAASFEQLDVALVKVFVDADAPAPLRADIVRVLGALWGEAPVVVEGAPDGSADAALWFSSTADAQAAAGGAPQGGYRLRRTDDSDQVLVIAAASSSGVLPAAGYALLETLGARFFHPAQDLLPSFDGARLPEALDVQRTTPFRLRGTQLHTLHPLEVLPAFLYDDDATLAQAEQVLDWLGKTGQNHLQYFLLETVPTEVWQARANTVIELAHARGITVNAVAQLWKGSSLQNAIYLIDDDTDSLDLMDARIDEIMAVPFDGLELGLGEFLATDPQTVVDWLNHATTTMGDRHPGKQLSVVNHVGNYPELYVEYEGETIFYYHLPGEADPRLVNTVHTVFYYDLYRPRGGYGHDDFALQRDFLLGELDERPVRYMPESAYWVSADIDVPAFLPEFVRARAIDANGLAADLAERPGSVMDGFIMYSSGWEWGYWLTEWASGRMLWDMAAPMEEHIDAFALPWGECADEMSSIMTRFIELQDDVLFFGELQPYVSGEDLHDDLGASANYVTIPARVPFETVRGMSDDERATFRRDVVVALYAAADESESIGDELHDVCARSDQTLRPWCDELDDGIQIDVLRMRHAAALYEAVLDAVSGDGDPEDSLAAARAFADDARDVIARREGAYRYDRDWLTGSGENPTRYKFGMYTQAHTLCLWTRREEQVVLLLETGEAASPFEVATCQE